MLLLPLTPSLIYLKLKRFKGPKTHSLFFTSLHNKESFEGYRPPTPMVVKVKSEKVKSIFGPLNLFNLRYIKEGVGGNNNIGIKKCTTIFLWVLNLGQVGKIFKNFQKHPLGEGF